KPTPRAPGAFRPTPDTQRFRVPARKEPLAFVCPVGPATFVAEHYANLHPVARLRCFRVYSLSEHSFPTRKVKKIKRRGSMKTTRSLLGLAWILTLVSGAAAQSISGQNPVVFDHTISWPLAFQFDGTGPTIDVGNRPGLNTPTFTVSAFVKFNALS